MTVQNLDRDTENNPKKQEVDAYIDRLEREAGHATELERRKQQSRLLRIAQKTAHVGERIAHYTGQKELEEALGDISSGARDLQQPGKGREILSNRAGSRASGIAQRRGLSRGKGAAIGGAVAGALEGEGVKGIAQTAASWYVVDAAIIALPTLAGSIPALIYLNLHYILSKFGFKWFREMMIWQKLILLGADLLAVLLIALAIVIPLAVLYVGCNPQGVGQWIASGILYRFIPDDICSALEGATSAVGTVIEKTTDAMCAAPKVLAEQNNEPYPTKNDPDLDKLITCVSGKVPNPGQIYTWDQSKLTCNYTRGQKICETCSHSVNSCHYGGSTGSTGSLAVDFTGAPGFGNEGGIGPQILQAVLACSSELGIPLKRSTCELRSEGQAAACNDPNADHVHTSIAKCTSDNGPINSQ